MKTQVTSILLCALLCSTWGHEYLQAKKLAPEAKSRYSPLSHLQKRAAPQEQCEWVCEGDGGVTITGGLQISVNETTGLVGIVNITAEVALIIDINANLVGLFNGTSGDVVIINIKTNVGVYITGSQTTKTWISSKLSFELYFKSLTSLQVLIDLKVGTTFKVSSVPTVVLEVIASLLVKLSARIGVTLEGNLKLAITILIEISTSIITSLRGQLNGLLKLFGSGFIALYGDILWLVSVFKGLELFFSKISGGLAALLKLHVEFDLAILLGAANGIELLINLLLAIVVRVDLGSILGDLLNSVEILIELIAKLGGNLSSGLTGVFRIIAEILLLRSGAIKIETLIETILEFAVQQKTSIDISISITGLLKVIDIQESLHSSTSIQVFVTFVQNLQNGKLVIGGINISGIISVLVKGAVNGVITLVVSVLLLLTVVVKSVVAIPCLLFYLLGLLDTIAGAKLLKQIIPEISIDVTVSSNTAIIIQVFRGINIESLLKLILSGFDVNVVLTSVPVLGQIYTAIATSVSTASKGSLSLKTILKSSSSASVVLQIKAWIQGAITIVRTGGTSSSSSSTSTSKSGIWILPHFGFKSAHNQHHNNEERHHAHHN